ncbi:hypothetical protein MNBD_UNCLBAC01-851 [hydrothermal vent metagenome]|uniref:Uncharacterized protein n=1 Tax=hydrothermal vent metagenome TaxID=652676 RepID=A0A3B1D6Q7_9ZZZZ
MTNKSSSGLMRTIIFLVLAIPVILFLLQYSKKRHGQFEEKAQACMDRCVAEGHEGADFKWAALSKEECTCLDSQ